MKRLVRSTKTGIFCTQCDKSIPVNTSRIIDGGMHSHYECLNKLKLKEDIMIIEWKDPDTEKPDYDQSSGSTCVLLSLKPKTTQYPIKAWYDGFNFWGASNMEVITNADGWDYFPTHISGTTG